MPPISYASAEKYILSREFFGMKLGLENITEFLDIIGTPQNSYKTIHISGTNGKGSTANMLAKILEYQGYKVGLFTSPHLVSFRERAKVNGKLIPKQSVSGFISRNKKLLSKMKLSFFELTTALALDHFHRQKVDIAVIETGLGGRLDATNVLKPILTITTDISKDHMEILGSSITKIAYEKAGIIKTGTPHLIGLMPQSAVNVFKKRAKVKKSKLIKLKRSEFKHNEKNLSLDFKDKNLNIKNLKPALIGTHQLKNTTLVLKAISVLKDHGLKISRRSVVEGIKNTHWAGRFQIERFKNKPLHILDVTHNAAGMVAFIDSFKKKFPDKKAHILTGFVKRKEHQKLFNSLSEIAVDYSLVPLSTKRSTDLNELIGQINFRGIPYKKYGSLRTAYTKLLKTVADDDIIVIIGSHYLVGEFITKFIN